MQSGLHAYDLVQGPGHYMAGVQQSARLALRLKCSYFVFKITVWTSSLLDKSFSLLKNNLACSRCMAFLRNLMILYAEGVCYGEGKGKTRNLGHVDSSDGIQFGRIKTWVRAKHREIPSCLVAIFSSLFSLVVSGVISTGVV